MVSPAQCRTLLDINAAAEIFSPHLPVAHILTSCDSVASYCKGVAVNVLKSDCRKLSFLRKTDASISFADVVD